MAVSHEGNKEPKMDLTSKAQEVMDIHNNGLAGPSDGSEMTEIIIHKIIAGKQGKGGQPGTPDA